MKLKEDFHYVENRTLTGNRLIIGLKNSSSYTLIPNDYKDSFYMLLKKIDNGKEEKSVSDKERELLEILQQKGYLEGYGQARESFNEYNALVKVFWRKSFTEDSTICQHKKIFYVIYAILCILCVIVFIRNIQYINMGLDIRTFSFTELLICLTIVPFMVDLIHELGHYIIAKILRLGVKDFSIGFFVTWPVIYFRYRGLNLQSMADKLCVLSGGVLAHACGVMLGELLGQTGVDSNIITVWIVANISMIITNLLPGLPGDGYFILSNILGIYNLRYKGYKELFNLMNQRKLWTSRENIFAYLMVFLWINSFLGLFMTGDYYSTLFGIDREKIQVVIYLLLGVLIIRFIFRLFKMKKKFELSGQ